MKRFRDDVSINSHLEAAYGVHHSENFVKVIVIRFVALIRTIKHMARRLTFSDCCCTSSSFYCSKCFAYQCIF